VTLTESDVAGLIELDRGDHAIADLQELGRSTTSDRLKLDGAA
jgi:hypothetical protein